MRNDSTTLEWLLTVPPPLDCPNRFAFDAESVDSRWFDRVYSGFKHMEWTKVIPYPFHPFIFRFLFVF